MKRAPDDIFDELLVLKCQGGDSAALSILIKRWHPKLLRQANRHLYDPDSSKDVVQESWQAVIGGIHKLKDPARFGGWALSITSRKAIDWIRKKQLSRSRAAADIEFQKTSEGNASAMKEVLHEKVSAALAKLPDDQRIVLSMFYMESQSIAEISDILKIPVGTVKSRLYHAREHLKRIIEK